MQLTNSTLTLIWDVTDQSTSFVRTFPVLTFADDSMDLEMFWSSSLSEGHLSVLKAFSSTKDVGKGRP